MKHTSAANKADVFQKKYTDQMNVRRNKYKIHHAEFIQLLSDIVIDLRENVTQDTCDSKLNDENLGLLKTAEYLLSFICKYKKRQHF